MADTTTSPRYQWDPRTRRYRDLDTGKYLSQRTVVRLRDDFAAAHDDRLRDLAHRLATRDLTNSNARRVVMRELGAGILNGLGLSVILGLGALAVFGQPMLGVVLGLAMIVNQIVAAMGGVMVPLGLEKLGLDPALASGTFVTTLTDVMGYLTFLGLATMLML